MRRSSESVKGVRAASSLVAFGQVKSPTASTASLSSSMGRTELLRSGKRMYSVKRAMAWLPSIVLLTDLDRLRRGMTRT